MDVGPHVPSVSARTRSPCVYRRRVAEDMTALPDEIEGAVAEGAELKTLMAPVRIEADENHSRRALWVQPADHRRGDQGRPSPSEQGGSAGVAHSVRTSSSWPSARASRSRALSRRACPSTRRHVRRGPERQVGDIGQPLRRRRLRHRSRHRHPSHRRGQGRRGQHRRAPRLPPRDRGRRRHSRPAAEQPRAARAHQHHRARGLRAQLRL